MNTVTFEQLPAAMEQVMAQLSNLQQMVQEQTKQSQVEQEELLNVKQVAALLGLKEQTIYGLVRNKKIPHSKPEGNLYFFRSEVLAWVKAGRRLTQDELEAAAKAHLSANRKHR
jgi:excisionase family DNA binding protein